MNRYFFSYRGGEITMQVMAPTEAAAWLKVYKGEYERYGVGFDLLHPSYWQLGDMKIEPKQWEVVIQERYSRTMTVEGDTVQEAGQNAAERAERSGYGLFEFVERLSVSVEELG